MSEINRKTNETEINLSLKIRGNGKAEISIGCGFLKHMLMLFAKHSGFNLSVSCRGDTEIDYHHTTEDVGICLGRAFREELGDARGINRYGSILLPMDEALILCAADVSGRGAFYPELALLTEKVGDFDTELCEEFFNAFSREAGITLHLRQITGKNSHHIIEGCFKATARALKQAVAIDSSDPDSIPSSKGVLG